MTISHSDPPGPAARQIPVIDPLTHSFGIGLATRMMSDPGTPRAIVGTESGVALVEVTVSRRGENGVVFTVPAEAYKWPRDLGDALSTQESFLSPVHREVQARAAERLAANTLLLPRSDRWREAISTALLGSWSAPLWTKGHLSSTAIGVLKAEARRLHRQLVPLWRRRTRHGRVLSLDAALGDGLSLYDLVAADLDLLTRVSEGAFDDERLNAVLRGLTMGERQVVLARAYDMGATWMEAAAAVGAREPEVFGERVRRKAQRLAAEQRRRLAQRSANSGPFERTRYGKRLRR